jgi:hypothetical protein
MSFLGYKSSDHYPESLVRRIGNDMIAVYDWLSGPPMTDRQRIKFQAVRARAELRILEMYMIGSWGQHTVILPQEELLDESADSQGTIGLRAEHQHRSAVMRPLV